MILIGIATLTTAPKEPRSQALLRFSFTICQMPQIGNHYGELVIFAGQQ
jgi:hypothetical protein